MGTPNSMKCTLRDGVFFKPKKKKDSFFRGVRDRSTEIKPYILKVNLKGKIFVAEQHPEVQGTWAEICEAAQKMGYSGVKECSGLRRSKTFPSATVGA